MQKDKRYNYIKFKKLSIDINQIEMENILKIHLFKINYFLNALKNTMIFY